MSQIKSSGGNATLHRAKKGKNDEFYTQLSTIEEELFHYESFFRGKTVLCNCDDPRVSNFFRYFAIRFNTLGLKRVITTCYKNNCPDLFSRNAAEQAVYLIYDGNDGGRMPDFNKVDVKPLRGDGDFRSPECIELLRQADVVVTNPPFSLFREYVAQLVAYDKKFLIIGNQNAITYKEIFPLIKENKLWIGYSIHSGDREFGVPDNYPLNAAGSRIDENGRKYIRIKGVRWFTNMDHAKRHEKQILYKHYIPEEYPKYDNYDAINVNKTKDIPCDYDGVMGVPITFLDKYNPEQFEIVEFRRGKDGRDLVYSNSGKDDSALLQNTRPSMSIGGLMNNPKDTAVGGKSRYARILVRRCQSPE